jgi:predicted amidohydrolase
MEYEMTLVAKQQVESFFNQTAHELGFRLAVVLLCMAAGLSAQSTNQARQSDKLRLGLYSAVPARWDLDANWATFERTVMAHASDGIDLIVTPECYLDGYVVEANDWDPQRFAAVAQDVETSPYIKRLRALAAQKRTYIVLGFTERSGGKIYDSAIMVDRDGRTAGIYHKTHLQEQDLRFSPGDDLPVFDTEWGKMGVLICADRRWPEPARVARLKGARITLIPSYGMWHIDNEWWMRTRSWENGNFIAFAHPNVAFVSDPEGKISAKLQTNVPGMLVCDVDLSRLRNTDINDRRPELYKELARPK